MRYEPRDRSPICDFGFWEEVPEVWRAQGLPAEVTYHGMSDYLGMDRYESHSGVSVGLCPGFEYKVLEDRGDHEVIQDWEGVRTLRKKFLGSIPIHLGHLLEDRDSWNEHYKPRLNPDTPERIPANFAQRVEEMNHPDYPYPVVVGAGSLYGWLRNWFGMENLAYVVYDDPAWFEEMVETITELILAVLQKQFDAGLRPDAAAMWEDMCYSGGPLLGLEHFRKYLVPRYRRITDLLCRYGVRVIWLDCDGKIDDLIPLWFDAGVNCMFPIEVGTWKGDPVRYRQEYGKDLLLIGGFDKRILSASKAEIEREVHRLTPLVEMGGFIPFCDHRVPPDVPYENYLHYLTLARSVWGKGVNLKPQFVLPGGAKA